MSRSNNTEIKNPAVKFFQWSGGDGRIKWYDKETKENVFVDAPFTFLVLDKLITITGFCDDEQSGYWSNEIRNTKRDILTVRTKSGIKKQGYYDEVKNLVGAKFAQSVYIAFYDDDKQLQIGNFKFNGCAVSSWIEFCKGRDVYKGAIKISGATEEKKGATKYFAPVFEAKEDVSESANEAAIELDKQLQEYLTAYFAMRGAENNRNVETDNESYIDQRNRELEDYKEDWSGEPQQTSFDAQEGRGEEISDDDIPF